MDDENIFISFIVIAVIIVLLIGISVGVVSVFLPTILSQPNSEDVSIVDEYHYKDIVESENIISSYEEIS